MPCAGGLGASSVGREEMPGIEDIIWFDGAIASKLPSRRTGLVLQGGANICTSEYGHYLSLSHMFTGVSFFS